MHTDAKAPFRMVAVGTQLLPLGQSPLLRHFLAQVPFGKSKPTSLDLHVTAGGVVPPSAAAEATAPASPFFPTCPPVPVPGPVPVPVPPPEPPAAVDSPTSLPGTHPMSC